MDTIQFKSIYRVPVVFEYARFAACAADVPMKKYVSSYEYRTKIMIQAYEKFEGGDGLNYAAPACYSRSRVYLSKVRMPGVGLPLDDELQVYKSELMKRSDYDHILEMG